jgi:Xanthine and CO dehydrogenases maturation factor, XdhC/CoxF family
LDFLDRLHAAKRDGKAVALCIVIETKGAVPRHAGSKMLVYADGQTEGTVGGENWNQGPWTRLLNL